MIKISSEYPLIRRLLSLIGKEHHTKTETRILSQVKFVCTLSAKNNGAYDEILKQSEEYLRAQFQTNGVWTKETATETEKILSPAAVEAKSYNYLCVAHAHIDMNWMWGYDETVGTTVDTFRTMLDLMKEYPSYKFSQSQASVYKIIEENAPEILEEIKERVKEGRWELTASTWVETDKNMPSGESLSRHILYTKEYLSNLFDIRPEELEIDFEPDTFGHNQNVPEILSNGGVKYYYHCRGQLGENILQKWVAPSGADVLLYTEPFWYNATIDEHIADYATELERITGSKTLLKVYGVGNHGGGPTRRDIERLIDMNSWPVYPTFTFSFLKDYFHAVENLKATRPVIHGEINFLCDGCYTTQTRIKAGNRKSEALLREAEAFSVMAQLKAGKSSPTAAYQTAWEKVLFNQFHDIIPGSGVTETREYASALYQQVFGTAETNKKTAFRQICDRIDTSKYMKPNGQLDSISEGGGAGSTLCDRGIGTERAYVLFNDEVVARTEITELVLWDYEGDLDYLCVKDSEGKSISCQITERNIGYWGHYFSRVLIEATVPAMGYALYIVCEAEALPIETTFENDMRIQTADEFILENDFLRVRLNPLDGAVASIIDKATDTELVNQTHSPGLFRLVQEAGEKSVTGWNTGMSAWFVGRYHKIESAQQKVEMKMLYNGAVRTGVRYKAEFGEFGSSSMTVTISLDKGSKHINFHVDCDWREFGTQTQIPALNFHLPLSYRCQSYKYDTAFGTIDRAERDMDLPGCSFAAALSKECPSLMLMSKSKYGYRCHDNSIALTLIRSACDPDPTPEIGKHTIDFAIAVADNSFTNHDYIQNSSCYNHPFSVASTTNHMGELSATDSLISHVSGNIMVSAVKSAEKEKGCIIMRIYETNGVSGAASFALGFTPTRAELTDITEKEARGAAAICGNTVSFKVEPHKMYTVKIYC